MRVLAPLLMVMIVSLAACGGKEKSTADGNDVGASAWPDTLRVGTLYSPGGYFIYRDEEMGYHYAMVQQLCDDKNIEMTIEVAPTLGALVEMLQRGDIDLIAYDIPVTGDYTSALLHCGPVNESHQVLVQPTDKGVAAIGDVTELAGHTVWVEEGTKYHSRLRHLNDEIGGGIDIRIVDRDTLITEDLIDMVAAGEIDLTIADNDIARVSRTYHPSLDVSVELSLPQRASWGVATDNKALADSIDAWFGSESVKRANSASLRRYYELGKGEDDAVSDLDLTSGHISAYDAFFKKEAERIGWDWRLLASIGYVESGFDPALVSWAGARGIMQIMPVAAKAFGSTIDEVTDPATSIHVAADILQSLDKSLTGAIGDERERRKFVLASYNSGIAHIRDAIVIADSTGHNPAKWHGNVAEALLLKSNPQYYNLPGCKYGYFNGHQTYAFVDKVYNFYERTKRHVPL